MCQALLVLSLVSLSPAEDRATKMQLENAANQMRQAAYELGIDLALHEKGEFRNQFRKIWSAISKIRSLGCERKVRDAFRNATQVSGSKTLAPQKLVELKAELNRAGFRDQAADIDRIAQFVPAQNWESYRHDLVRMQDEISGAAAGLKLHEINDILRDTERLLGMNPTPAKMDQALSVLSQLPNFENGRARALTEAVQIIDDTLDAAADLYMEGYFQDAQQTMRQLDRPFRLLSRIQDPRLVLRVKQLRSQIEHARKLIEVGVSRPNSRWYVLSSDQSEGLRLLHQCRSEAANILDAATSTPAPIRNSDR